MINELTQHQDEGLAGAVIPANRCFGTKIFGALGVCLFVVCLIEYVLDNGIQYEVLMVGGAVSLLIMRAAGVLRCYTRCPVGDNVRRSLEGALPVHVRFLDQENGNPKSENPYQPKAP